MITIDEPEVLLVGRPDIDAFVLQEFLEGHDAEGWKTDAGGDGDALPEIAGRLCYMSYSNPRPGGNRSYLAHIKEVGHGSVLEHSNWNFILQGVSRSLTHELVRHRAGMSFSQLSQRYVDSADVAFVVPPQLRLEVECARCREWLRDGHDDASEEEIRALFPLAAAVESRSEFGRYASWGDTWLNQVGEARLRYKHLTDYLANKLAGEGGTRTEKLKRGREAARSVLPNATETRIFVTANARALRHFFALRGSRHADAEIRRLAVRWLRLMRAEAPALFDDFAIAPLPDGSEEATTPHPKV